MYRGAGKDWFRCVCALLRMISLLSHQTKQTSGLYCLKSALARLSWPGSSSHVDEASRPMSTLLEFSLWPPVTFQ